MGLVVPLLAGCIGGPTPETPPPAVVAVPPDDLEAGTFYAFDHGGGDVVFSVAQDGSAGIVLYDGEDRRVGRIELGAEQASGRFVVEGLDAGELVVDLTAINGTLDIRSGGQQVGSFLELPRHIERHILVQRAPSMPYPVPIGLLASDLDETVEVGLLRSPSTLRVSAVAAYSQLEVTVEGRGGLVYHADAGDDPVPVPGLFSGNVPGTMYDENVRDGALTVYVTATSFEGLLLLEAESFSRARPVAGGLVPTDDVPQFTYGELPEGPVAFEVQREARSLYFWLEPVSAPSEECEEAANQQQARCRGEAVVALFDPDDHRVATFTVDANDTLEYRLPEEPQGEWVAVALAGSALMGSDRIPSDFELHDLEVVETTVPADGASDEEGTYSEQREGVQADGVPIHVVSTIDYGVTSADNLGFLPGGCDAPSLRLLLGNETVGAWGFRDFQEAGLDPDHLLADGGLAVVHGDYGPGCQRLVLTFTAYER